MSSSTRVTGARKHLAGVLGVLFILLLWQSAAFVLPDFLMPGVPAVVERLFEDLGKQSFHQSLMGTLGRLGAGYSLALLAGIGFGLVAAVLFFFREVLRSAIVILQSIPSIAWVPLFLIVMGFGNTPIIVVVALSAFFPAALSVMNATESVQRVHVSAARVMGATRWGLVKRVYLPAVMPELITGAQLAFGNAWRALISAEMLIGFGKGLGRSLAYSGEIADMTGVMTNILVIAVLAALIDQFVLENLKHRLLRYQYV
ncbi:Bicarbonate transport system permease protein CmpB [Achromobacter spanius]|uniref:ABC transporter permease n=2 Tax=Achromobacter TaxID=222 RepID=A0AAW3I4Q9_9BURK|nr:MULTISPECIES: ABC transporter permease [Achromobacter]SPT42183.1 Bicarbonate transport system permease protein CmpB [Achromobacter denitrificans]AUA58070.1 ABC transporter permease [Achromobacter spanius]AZS79849.1 ABC transporter permease [Achromobacter spanius]KNE27582.1 ABC transporter permease [Achromobacter spanius]MCD0499084.1 ABC transporter permease [Achromobacter sp. MY14]